MKKVADFLIKRAEIISNIQLKSDNSAENRLALQNFSNQTLPVFKILVALEPNNPMRININKILAEGNRDASITYNNIISQNVPIFRPGLTLYF